MNERQVTEYIESISGAGIVPGLDSIKELCRRLDDPQDKLTFIHIAGTNGKGSVSTYIASALKAAGYSVGRYLSPTIFTYRERIQVNDRNISAKALGECMEQVKAACDGMVADGLKQPTAFEVETAVGFLYFVQKKCDYVVLEVGMGGTLDATNIVTNVALTVLASISRDHMKFLGETLTEIAQNKCGIFKPGVPVVSVMQEPEAELVVREKAEELHCPLVLVDRALLKNIKFGLEKQRFDYGAFKKMEIRLAGQYQIDNAATALAALIKLQETADRLTIDAIRKGFLDAKWPGRFTVLQKKPLFIVDGAHNEDAAKRLAESVDFYFTNKRIIYIMGILKDKEYEKVIGLTHRYADQIITVTPPENPRALPALELANEIAKVHPNVTCADSVEEAVEMSLLLAGKEDVIITFGSLSFLGRVMKLFGY